VASVEPGAPNRKATTTVPGFNTAPDSSQYYGVVYPGQVHAVDFFSAPNQPTDRNAAFATGFKMFTAALDQWLPHFQAGNGLTITVPTGTVTGTAATVSANAGAGNGNSNSKDHHNGAVTAASYRGLLAGAALFVGVMTW
jgi:hypothetical protein